MKKLLLALILCFFAFAASASAYDINQNVCYQHITTNGAQVTLEDDIDNCDKTAVIIDADNVVFDCDGYSIIGDQSCEYISPVPGTTVGIMIKGNNNIVKNCNIEHFIIF